MNAIKALTIAALLAVASSQCVANELLPLEHGTYVREGVSAIDPPFAAIIEYDGSTISGPHSSACRSDVLSHRGASYRISTTCDALGDGTPNAPYTEVERIVVTSSTTMRFAHDNDAASYRLVPAS